MRGPGGMGVLLHEELPLVSSCAPPTLFVDEVVHVINPGVDIDALSRLV